ncbi:fic family toxin-antitoxin system, toxin component [Streptomyces sp. NPDC046977]|uniref:fic family toxin-antitoxin system, toxin component n=1 Tax=Streptomyces sp. NPDC046977 TaxID=3154703 RepID=UPI0033C18494
MTHPEPELAEVSWLLQVAEHVTGDPQLIDLGPLFAAVSRHRSRAMNRDVYGSVWLKAAALMETLARLPALEHSNRQFAWLSAVAFLTVNGCTLDYPQKDAVALVNDVARGATAVQASALQLRRWAV